jgi:hypothetical protein
MRKLLLVLIVLAMAPFCLGNTSGCTDADIASENISKAAESFEIYRRIVFVNGITDSYILSVEGRCSVEFYTDKFTVTCKLSDDEYVKHYLGRADNVFPFVNII